MYAGDADDTAPLDTEWDGGFPIWFGSAGSDFQLWSSTIQPYVKSNPLDQDPLQTFIGPVTAGWAASWWYGYQPEYGYNYTVWSPTTSFTPPATTTAWPRSPATFTTVARPADVVLFTEHCPDLTTIWDGPGSFLTIGNDEPVFCNAFVTTPGCFNSWGLNGELAGFGAPWNDPTKGGGTGMVMFTKGNSGTYPVTGFTTTTFGDGHAKSMSPGALAVGTNYSGTINATAVVINNLQIYRWTNQ
jgi:hypothetical protein